MALHRTQGIVIGRRALGESDRLVDFYTRDYGRVRGVAKSARQTRSRFGSALELFTLGELSFFDTGRSELVRVDHFDIAHPFVRVRENLERLGQGAWVVECDRLTAPRPAAALFGLALRSSPCPRCGARPQRVATASRSGPWTCSAIVPALIGVSNAARYRSRTRRWTWGRADSSARAAARLRCPRPLGATVGLLKRLRALGWEEGAGFPSPQTSTGS
jgi:DNA repair protein RecO (recombination protein O)